MHGSSSPIMPIFTAQHTISKSMGRKKFVGMTGMKIGMIGDEETVTGMVLAGVGDVKPDGQKNFMVVNAGERPENISKFFHQLTARTDIAMILITQRIAEEIAGTLEEFADASTVIPTVLQIPSKECPYDPYKDPIMARVKIFQANAFEKWE